VGTRHLNLLKSDFGGGRFNMGYANLTFKMTVHLVTVEQMNRFLISYVKPPVAQLLKNLTTYNVFSRRGNLTAAQSRWNVSP
jgi:hypothetical protein